MKLGTIATSKVLCIAVQLSGRVMKKAIYPVLLVIFTMMLTSVTSSQAIPSQSTYYACVKKSTGVIKIVKANKKCKKSEKKINWSNTGPAGQDGIPGLDGQDGGYELMLSPADLTPDIGSQNTSLQTLNVDGYSRSAWVLSHEAYGTANLLASFAAPTSWSAVSGAFTTVEITVFWTAESDTGDINLFAGGRGLVVGNGLVGFSDGQSFLNGPPPAIGVLQASTVTIEIDADSGLVDVMIQRYMNSGVDTNDGDIYILGVKVAAVPQ
jgi:hypothetical protein